MKQTYKATKVVIITEKLILKKVAKIIDTCGATGYTITSAGGKGSRNIRSNDRAQIVDDFSDIKIEVITGSNEMAHEIIDQVAEGYFKNYPGIAYLEEVEILRPHKFKH